jgi:hypothetical protein
MKLKTLSFATMITAATLSAETNTTKIKNKFDGFNISIGTQGSFSSLKNENKSEMFIATNEYLTLNLLTSITFRYGMNVQNSEFWLGAEANLLNFGGLRHSNDFSFLIYRPTTSLVLGYTQENSLTYLSVGGGYLLPYANNPTVEKNASEGGLAVSLKIGQDFLISDQLTMGFFMDISYNNFKFKPFFQSENSSVSGFNMAIGYQMGIQF